MHISIKLLCVCWLLFFVCLASTVPLCAQTADTLKRQGTSTVLPAPEEAPSQLSSPTITRMLEVGISANAYRGDLAMKYKKWASAFHVGLKLNYKKRINSHFNLSVGSITGQNPDYTYRGASEKTPAPNLFFKTNYLAGNYDLQINLIKKQNWIVYVSQGIGLIRYEPKSDQNASLQDQFQTREANESYGNVSLLLPTQAGAIYLFNNGYGAGIQTGWLNPQTDYLDNISKWGNRQKKDNVLWFRFSFIAPLSYKTKE